MKARPQSKTNTVLTFSPLTEKNWADLETLFGPRGASGGCWCMWWKLRRSEYEKKKGAGNRRAFRKIVDSGAPTGVLAYEGGQPVGWCAVAPREAYPVLENSRVLKAVDEQAVWSVTCFYVPRARRRSGLTAPLLDAAFKLDLRKWPGARRAGPSCAALSEFVILSGASAFACERGCGVKGPLLVSRLSVS